jgi:peptidylamidoglycolate lyase
VARLRRTRRNSDIRTHHFSLRRRIGKLRAKWGEKVFALPHSITVDSLDNVWVADVALHQVFKFSHDGKLLLTIGERAKPGIDTNHFNRPSDVAVARDGSFMSATGMEIIVC